MKTICLLILSFTGIFAPGCGKKNKLEIPGEVMPYVARFEQLSSQYSSSVQVTDLIIRFVDLPNPQENGACEVSGDETPQISLDGPAWQSMDDSERESLVFHELGHCVLRRRHRDEKNFGIPLSVMYTYALHSAVYTGHYHDYLTELYNRRNEF